MVLMMTKDRAAQAAAPPLNPGAPTEHRAGEAVLPRREVSQIVKVRLGAPLMGKEEGSEVEIKGRAVELPMQALQDPLLPLQGCQALLQRSGDRPLKSPWKRREEGLMRSKVPSVAGRPLLQDWVRRAHRQQMPSRAPLLRR